MSQSVEDIGLQITNLVQQIDSLLELNNGGALSNQAAKLAIQLEYLLEHKATAKLEKNRSYAELYEVGRKTKSQMDAKVYADSNKDMTYDNIEAIESGVKSVLSTVKDKLHWLELENQNKGF